LHNHLEAVGQSSSEMLGLLLPGDGDTQALAWPSQMLHEMLLFFISSNIFAGTFCLSPSAVLPCSVARIWGGCSLQSSPFLYVFKFHS